MKTPKYQQEISHISDADLLRNLRQGDRQAYTELWRRHVQAAMRVGHKVAPGRADDLVAEAFLAVYRQITQSSKGPEVAFRAYLFTTMRNLATRWSQEDSRIDTVNDFENSATTSSPLREVSETDGLTWVEDRERASEVLNAFESLPDRWQKVLWLSEVEDLRRAEIAKKLGIKPSAVTALYRRARTGFKLQWLTQQLPSTLRNHPDHAARLFPNLALNGSLTSPDHEISSHLERCQECFKAREIILNAQEQMSSKALTATGLAALGVVLPASVQLSLGATGVSAATFTIGSIGTGIAVAASVGAIVIGGISIAHHDPVPAKAEASQGRDHSQNDESEEPGKVIKHGGVPSVNDKDTEETLSPSTGFTQNTLGRAVQNDEITRIILGDSIQIFVREQADRPRPTDASKIPQPPNQSTNADPSAQSPQHGVLEPPLMSPLPRQESYLGPLLSGSAAPLTSVAVEFKRITSTSTRSSNDYCQLPNTELHTAPVNEAGEWILDLRSIITDAACTYSFSAWNFAGELVSTPVTGEFAVSAPKITGFETLSPFESFPLTEASTTGIVFISVGGPANGAVQLVSITTGQSLEIPLNSFGVATKRVTFSSGGYYDLEFRVQDGIFSGPAERISFDVEDPDSPIFGPFGGSLEAGMIKLSDL